MVLQSAHFRALAGALTTGASLFALPAVCLAQDAPATDNSSQASGDQQSGFNDIVVTARRVEERLQDVPVSISAFNQEALDTLVVENAIDLSKLTAGLQTDACSGSRTTCFRPVIRGYGTTFGSGEASVVAYFAEVPNIPPTFFDLQNLQVLKGPQGTLFGETAVGGAILFEPRRPEEEFGGYVTAQLGNYDHRSLEFAVGGPILDDKILFRIAGQVRQRRGFVTAISTRPNQPPTDLDNVDNFDYRASLILRPFEGLENYTVFSKSYSDTNGTSNPIWYYNPQFFPAGIRDSVPSASPQTSALWQYYAGYAPPAGQTWGELTRQAYLNQNAAGPFVQFVNTDRRRETVSTSIVNQTRWDVTDNFALRNIFGLQWSKSAGGGTLEIDGVPLPLVDTGSNAFLNGISKDRWSGGYPSRTWTEEFQAVGSLFGDRLKYQAGVYYRYSAAREFQPASGQIIVFASPSGASSPAAACTDPTGVAGTAPCTLLSRSKSTSFGIYGQTTFAVTDTVNLTGGLRRTADDRSVDTTAGQLLTTTFNGFTIPLTILDTPRQPNSKITTLRVPTSKATTYNITADWKPMDDVLLYVAHRTGYKGGGINQNTLPDSPNRQFGPERITNWEVGIKADWSIGPVQFRTNIAAYLDKYSDVQRSTLIPGTATTVTQNIADIDNKGLEFEATAIFTDWLQVSGYFALIDASYADWTELTTCAANQYRPQCAGLPAATPVIVDHANGQLDVNGQITNFRLEPVANTSKYRWSVQPRLLLEPFLGEEITIGANIYSRTKYTTGDISYSLYAGGIATADPVGIFPSADKFANLIKGYTLVDLRIDWKDISGSRFSSAFSITNLANKSYMAGLGNPITICGCTGAVVGEPRMAFFELNYEF